MIKNKEKTKSFLIDKLFRVIISQVYIMQDINMVKKMFKKCWLISIFALFDLLLLMYNITTYRETVYI